MLPVYLQGCGTKADENKPLSQIKAEAAKMDAGNLRAMAMAYKEAIQAKLSEADALKKEIKEIPVTEILGGNAKALKQDLAPITQSIAALTERFKVYYGELKEKSGDLTGLDL